MDLLAHACYGATICSQSGIAGGRRGSGKDRCYKDSTVWWSVLFGLLPDMISMWGPLPLLVFSNPDDKFFRVRRLALPSLAWALHILCDMASHDAGKFRTMPLYPLTEWNIPGIAFWRNLWFVITYWAILVTIWICLIVWRHRQNMRA